MEEEEEEEEEKVVVRVLQQERPELEEKYHVRVSDDTLKLVSVHALGTFIISEDATLEKAVKILDGASKLVLENFKNNAYESELFDDEYVLRRAMAELKELYRDSHLESQSWVARVEWECNYAAFNLHIFLNKWNDSLFDYGGSEIMRPLFEKVHFFKDYAPQIAYLYRRLAEESITEDLTDRSNEAIKLVSEFLEEFYQRLLGYFLSSLTVKPCHVAEVQVGRSSSSGWTSSRKNPGPLYDGF